MVNIVRFSIICSLVILSLGACSSKKVAPVEKNALYYFQKGEQALEKGHHKTAIENWQKVRDSFSSPELTALAELKIADTQYDNKLYIEAIASYEDFLKQHPANIRKSDVLWRLGKAHFQEILAADRDQTATHNALNIFQQLKKNYPDKVNQQDLDGLILKCRNRLAENATYIGHFYLITKKYPAAIARLEQVRTTYPEFNDMGQVTLYLAQAQYLSGKNDQAAILFNEVEKSNANEKVRKEATKLRKKYSI